MAVPDFQSFMRPVLEFLSDKAERAAPVIRESVADALGLTVDDRAQLTPSGQKPLYHDRISWALTYLTQAGLLTRPKRGVYKITDRGVSVLSRHPERVDNSVLEQFPEFQEFLNRSGPRESSARKATQTTQDQTPDESLEIAFGRLRAAIEAELLQQVKLATPAFFEQLVVKLLVAMGYGGSLADAGKAIGKSGDGGIDGIIKEDRLGLDVIHVQAKRWENTVGRPEVQSFAGSLDGVRAKKGIFITTSGFSKEAREYVERIDKRIVLIDGPQLASLMYEFGIGVSETAVYAVRRVDADFFSEE